MNQTDLLEKILKIHDRSRPKTAESKNKKRNTYESAYALYEGRELILNVFRSGIFPIKEEKVKASKY